MDGQTYLKDKKIANIVLRGLLCLSPQTSRATAKNLDWIFEKLKGRRSIQLLLVEYAIEGLKSFFPATCDRCFQFLVHRLADLPVERREEFPGWISLVTSINLEYLQWDDGEAHLPFNGRLSGLDLFVDAYHVPTYEEVDSEVSILNDKKGSYVSPERVVKVLKYFSHNQGSITKTIVERILSFDEAALRAEVIRVWLVLERDCDDAILDRIFNDNHPSCALAALEGGIAGWDKYSHKRREVIVSGLRRLAANTVCATALINILVRFDRVEVTGCNPPWSIFEDLFPVVMASIPYNALDFVGSHLYSIMTNALTFLSVSSIVSICDKWIDLLEQYIKTDQLPSDYMLGVVDILIKATRSEPDARAGRIERLLSFSGTGSLLSFVADLVDEWSGLIFNEQMYLISFLLSVRPDSVWLQAAALTRSVIPREVQQKILGDQVTLHDGADGLLANIADSLLNAIVHVYTGQPQPLWWLGKHGSGKEVWEPVVEKIARLPQHALFELAWEHIFARNDGRLVQIVQDLGTTYGKRMLGILLRLKSGWTGNFMPEVWIALLGLAVNEDERQSWIKQMASYASVILDDLSDINLWLPNKEYGSLMFEELKYDYAIVKMTDDMFSLFEANSVESLNYVKLLEIIFQKFPPRLFKTCDTLRYVLEGHNVLTPELDVSLETCRKKILAGREDLKNSFSMPDQSLTGWIIP